MGLLEDVWYTTGEMLLLAHHVGFSSPLPCTWPVAILCIGQDQISIGKEPSATLLLNMGKFKQF